MPTSPHHSTNIFTLPASSSSWVLCLDLPSLLLLFHHFMNLPLLHLLGLLAKRESMIHHVGGWVWLAGSMSRLLLDALSTRRYPLCAVGYKRTREHLLAWKPVLPSVVKGAEVYLSRLEQEAPLSPHSGSWCVDWLISRVMFISEIGYFSMRTFPS